MDKSLFHKLPPNKPLYSKALSSQDEQQDLVQVGIAYASYGLPDTI